MGRLPLRYLEIGLIVLLLVVLGIVTFSRLSTEEKAVIELEASLEQLYHMEADYFARHKRYFDPQADDYRDYLPWLEDCACEVRFGTTAWSVIARADIDGDGEVGAWRIDESGGLVERLVED